MEHRLGIAGGRWYNTNSGTGKLGMRAIRLRGCLTFFPGAFFPPASSVRGREGLLDDHDRAVPAKEETV